MSVEEVFTAREVAAELGLAGAMLRRYATEYEAVAGSEIEVHRRNGRLFTLEQVSVLKKARALVSNQGLSVRSAMLVALGKDDSRIALRSAESLSKRLQGSEVGVDTLANSEVFAGMLKNAVQDGNKEVLEEIRKLNENLSRSNVSVQDASNLENSILDHNFEGQALEASKPNEHGIFVRFAMWVEKIMRR